MFLAILLTCALPQGRVEGGLPASPPQSSDQGNKPIFWAENVAIRRCGWVLRWTISYGLRLPPVSAFESALVALSGGWISPCSRTTRTRASTPGCMDGQHPRPWGRTIAEVEVPLSLPEAQQTWALLVLSNDLFRNAPPTPHRAGLFPVSFSLPHLPISLSGSTFK